MCTVIHALEKEKQNSREMPQSIGNHNRRSKAYAGLGAMENLIITLGESKRIC